MKAEGDTGTIEVTADAVLIRRRKIFGSDDDVRVIKISELVGIEFRKASIFERGYIKLIYAGSGSSSDLSIKAHDRNTVTFGVEREAEFLPIRANLMERITGAPFVANDDDQVHGKCALVVATLISVSIAVWFISVIAGS